MELGYALCVEHWDIVERFYCIVGLETRQIGDAEIENSLTGLRLHVSIPWIAIAIAIVCQCLPLL